MEPTPPVLPTLFARGGALGDFVLTLPVLDALLRGPGPVELAVTPRFLPLVEGLVALGAPRPTRCFDLGGPDATWIFGGRAPRPYARAVAFSRAVGEGLRSAGIPEVVWVEATPTGPAGAHFARVLGEERARLGPPRIRMPPGPTGPLPSGPLPIVLAPGAGGRDKRLPIAWWEALAARLPGPVVWVAGPVEADEDWPVPPGRPGLVDLARLATCCRLWIGADSGPSHLAVAARRGAGLDPGRVVVLFTTTEPRVWAPVGAQVVAAPDPGVALETVLAALLREGDPAEPAL